MEWVQLLTVGINMAVAVINLINTVLLIRLSKRPQPPYTDEVN